MLDHTHPNYYPIIDLRDSQDIESVSSEKVLQDCFQLFRFATRTESMLWRENVKSADAGC